MTYISPTSSDRVGLSFIIPRHQGRTRSPASDDAQLGAHHWRNDGPVFLADELLSQFFLLRGSSFRGRPKWTPLPLTALRAGLGTFRNEVASKLGNPSEATEDTA